MDSEEATAPVIEHVLEMLEQARTLARDAIAARERRGEELTSRTPPVVALRVLDDEISKVADGSRGPSSQVLGLSRGAGDLEWPAAEEPLLELFSQIDHYWHTNVWNPATVQPSSPSSVKIRHVPPGSLRR
jgi:hypothetical protein